MKKSTKIWCIVAGSMIAVGLCLGIIGGIMGGSSAVARWFANGELTIGPFGFRSGAGLSEIEFNENYPIESGSVAKTELEIIQEIGKIEIQVGGVRLNIKQSEDNTYSYESINAGQYQCYAEGDTLVLRSSDDFGVNADKREITLYIPYEENYDHVGIEIGGGVIETDGILQANETQIDIGAGTLEMQGVSGSLLQVDIGAGTAQMSNVQIENADLEVGMGQLIMQGDIRRSLQADCAMGSMQFQMESAQESHNYEVDCAMGNIRIGSHSYAGMGMEQTINNQADSDYSLSCSMGEIKMQFR